MMCSCLKYLASLGACGGLCAAGFGLAIIPSSQPLRRLNHKQRLFRDMKNVENWSIFGQNGPKFSKLMFIRSHIVARRKKNWYHMIGQEVGFKYATMGPVDILIFFFKNFEDIKFGP